MTYLSITGASKYLGQSREFIETLIAEGSLKCKKIGKRIYTRKDWLDGIEADKNKNQFTQIQIRLSNDDEMSNYLRESKEKWLNN